MSRHLRFDIPHLARMRAAGSSGAVWRSVTNDVAYQLERRLEAAFGVDVSLMLDDDPATWQMLQRLFMALDRARRVLDYVLAVLPASRELERADVLERWLAEEQNGVESVQRVVLLSIVSDLLNAVAFKELGTATSGRFALDALVEVAVTGVDDEPAAWSSDEFHVFISYKHRLYSGQARTLHDALVARGLRVWLDRSELPIAPGVMIRDILLKRRLKQALSVSRHTVFFETIGEMHADDNFRGERAAHNWQSFEHRYARDLIYVRPNGDLVIDHHPGQSVVHAQFAVDYLADRCSQSSAPARRAGFGPIAGTEPDLDQASNELRAQLAHAFGADVTPSPLAEIALLAPGSAETGMAGAAYGGDVLIQLLRYDAASALELHRAGLDLYWLFAVGAKLNDQRWQRPRELLIADVFGPAPSGFYERVRGKRALSTADILRGILEFAAGNSFARDMLRLAVRAGRRGLAEPDIDRAVDEFRTRAFEILKREERAPGVHGWLLVLTPDGLHVMPTTDCGTIRAGNIGPGRLLARQSPRLFLPEAVDRFGAALASRRGDEVERMLQDHKEIARTLTGAITVTRTQDVSRPGHEGQVWLTGAETGSRVAPEVTRDALFTALDTLERRPTGPGEIHRWPWGDRAWHPCVVVAPATRSQAMEVSPFELIADVLEPLDAYLSVRTLEYDDF